MLRVLDLFSGIGGFSLGLERTGGFETAAFCEYEAFPRAVLAKHWPDVPCFPDVRTLKGSEIDGPIDVVVGGYPCQPFSTAGRRKGQEDDRHLWPEFNRLVAELRPAWVIGENVAGHISMGLDDVLSDLEGQGYACRTFVVPACATGAPHRRDRVWTVANASGRRSCKSRQREEEQPGRTKAVGGSKDVADAPQLQRDGDGEHPEQSERQVRQSGKRGGAQHVAHAQRSGQSGQSEHDQPSDCQAQGEGQANNVEPERQSRKRSAEPGMGFTFNGISQRLDRIRGLKNANAAKERAVEILSNLPEEFAEKAFQRASRRLNSVSETQVLLAFLCEYERRQNGKSVASISAEYVEEILRGVWHTIEIASAPLQPRCDGQFARDYSDALHQLSRNTPSQFPAAWGGCFWEDDIPRVAKGVKNRANRLKALGNAVVPQIPEMIGRAILEAENA